MTARPTFSFERCELLAQTESAFVDAFCSAMSEHLSCPRSDVARALAHYSANLSHLLASPAGWVSLGILMVDGDAKSRPLPVSIH